MAFPHILKRSGRSGGRGPRQEGSDPAAVARQVSAQLGSMLDRAEGADLQMLAYLIECARIEAERVAASGRL